MVFVAVLCLCAAVAVAGLGLWLLTRPRSADPRQQILRAVAPTQLAASVMLAAGGVVALAAPPETGVLAVIACGVGAVATVAAGCWQSAKVVARTEAAQAAAGADADCAGSCASCVLSCR
ncbi:hypothetical protein [Mycolicibacterium monacense]|uniref:Transmembrane protein n=4 Tax=Mycobacteriaceae TaxID=1762 RepID=A0AAD1N200_MYCMB|nr:hypothetical protein [Mycolicibacterium monacense]MDA4103479.1 membrane protein [Mycolicibacterium monacense DSM 44395]OBF55107.1 hypothetical protein A5778_09110 [Mycolicibacterium monacense]ORB12457.1 hypothetical protein BST34_26880 [Mycolicibacterium monacense DSM 44395]QHP89064.1 hypothetical protein EWR22_28955 [Mycolicibacterium monacense DSM 44395]BBZ63460.1 hypothetical protein MMON_47610 [Mycolicibacterium monacense]